MRVLHVTESFGAGVATAIEQYISSTAGEVDSSLLAAVRADSSQDRPSTEDPSRTLVATRGRLIATWRAMRDSDHDVIHVHSTLAALMVRVWPHRTAPVVYSPHALAALHHRRRAVRTAVRFLEHRLRRRTAVYVAVGEAERRDLERLARGIVPVDLVPHAITPAEQPVERRRRARRVAAVGRLTYQKAPDTVLDFPARAAGRGLQVDWTWVGDGDEELRTGMTAAGWHVTGWIPREEVRAVVAESLVLVHPARYEGQPLAVLEAMCLGTPVVGRDIDGIRELQGVEVFDREDRALEQIAELCDDPESWERHSRAALRGTDDLSPSAQCRRLLHVYGLARSSVPTGAGR